MAGGTEMIQGEMPGLIISACRTSIWLHAATSAFLAARTRGFSSAPYEEPDALGAPAPTMNRF
ncbi:hypothetical protein KCP70_04730 [Salmonella enterica subsp. enterica]|nr:hypothetical protein KCP70_04730 [Salmonella enterica subsp. enterica]